MSDFDIPPHMVSEKFDQFKQNFQKIDNTVKMLEIIKQDSSSKTNEKVNFIRIKNLLLKYFDIEFCKQRMQLIKEIRNSGADLLVMTCTSINQAIQHDKKIFDNIHYDLQKSENLMKQLLNLLEKLRWRDINTDTLRDIKKCLLLYEDITLSEHIIFPDVPVTPPMPRIVVAEPMEMQYEKEPILIDLG